MARGMRFKVLGPIEVSGSNGPVPIRGEKERTILALLLVNANEVVSEDQLIAATWGESPPRTASKTLHSYISRLRTKLEPQRLTGGTPEVLVTKAPGYVLSVDPNHLDAARFERLGIAGSRQLRAGAVNLAAAGLREALALWQGIPYQDLQSNDVIALESERLNQLRLSMLEERIEAEIRLGRERDVILELEELVREEPLRERLWELLMLAHYRAGRQADAVATFASARNILREELGVDPGPDLQRLQREILSQDPALEERWAPAPLALPPQLDPATPLFGRSQELRWLTNAWKRAGAGTGGFTIVEGASGMGKTRLVAELARHIFESGASVLYGSCSSEDPDYRAPLAQVLAQCGGVLEDVLPEGADGEEAGPSFVDHVLDRAPGDRVLMVVEDIEHAQRELLEILASGLRSLGEERPLVVVLSHDKDAPPGSLWSFLDRVDPLRHARLSLGPLGPNDVRRIVQLYAEQDEVAAAVEAVGEKSGGSPLKAHQMAAAYVRARVVGRIADAAEETTVTRARLRTAEHQLVSGLEQIQQLEEPWPVVVEGAEEVDGRSPYKGLASFGPEDRHLFFGRERLVAQMAARLVGASVLGVVGPSGSGKSSAIAAGLLPGLAQDVLPGSAEWAQIVMRPGEHPLAELGCALRAVVGNGGPNFDLEQFVRTTGPALLVIDQFEELFTSCEDEAERSTFVQSITGLATDPEMPLSVVVGIRSDLYGRAGSYRALADLLSRNHVLVGPMHAGELRDAIERPAIRAGARVEPALVDSLVEDVLGEPGALPLLSASLVELWQRRDGRDLLLGDYRATGGVRGAVARLAEKSYATMTIEERLVSRRMFLRLVDPTEHEAHVRRRASLAEFDLDSDPLARRVLTQLVDDRLVTTTETSVELAHDALLREWPRLREWIEEETHATRLHRHLTRAAGEWEANRRDPSEFYRGARLAAALEWRDAGTGASDMRLNDLEREFLHASAEVEERARRQRARQVRTLAWSGATAIVLFALLALFGLLQAREADRQGELAFSREIAAEASNQLGIDPQLSLLLALEAYEIAPSAQAQAALRQAVVNSHLRAVLPGNAGFITSQVAFSPDDRVVATGGLEGARLWDPRTGQLVAKLPEGAGTNAIAFSPDGTRLAVGVVGQDSNIWSVAEHEILATLPDVSGGGANHVEWVSNVKVLSARADGTATISDAATGKAVVVLEAGAEVRGENIAGPISDVDLSPRRDLIAAVDELGQTRVWRASTGSTLVTLSGHEGPVNAVDFSPDGKLLATVGDDFTGRIWDVATGQSVHVLRGHKSQVLSVRFTPDGRSVVTGDAVGELRVWRTADGGTDTVLLGQKDAIFWQSLAFTPDGRFLVSGSADATVSVWDLETGGRVAEFLGHTGRVEGVAVSSDGRRIATAADDGARIWRTPPGATRVLRGHEDSILTARLSADHHKLVTGSFDGTARVWQLESGRTLRVLRPGENIFQVGSASFSPDGRRVVTAASGSEFLVPQVWEVSTGRVLQRIPIQERSVPDLCGPAPCPVVDSVYSPEEDRIALVRFDGRVFIWDVASERIVQSMKIPEGGAGRADWSPDGDVIVVSSPLGGDPRLFDSATGDVLHVLKGHKGQQQSAVSFSRDGRFVATTSHDATARVWDVATGEAVAVLRHRSKVSRAVFSANGRFLLTASGPAATLWDIESEKSLTQFPGHRGEVTWVEFVSPRRILSASDDRTVRLFNCEVCGTFDELLELARNRVHRSLTAPERERFLHASS
jgi:WD40 repeat protein/DNA-binding SARP family transcriptional activator